MAIASLTRGDTFGPYLASPAKNASGSVVDISGATVYFTMKADPSAADIDADFQTSFTAPSNSTSAAGIVSLTLSSAQTVLDPGTYYYDIQVSIAATPPLIYTVENGRLSVIQDITLTDEGDVVVSPGLSGIVSVTDASYDVASTDRILLVNATSNAVSVNLPAVDAAHRTLWIKRMDGSANSVTVIPDGSDTIDGASSFVLSTQYEAIVLVSDLVTWNVF